MVSRRQLEDFHTRLHGWYATHGRRDLPWRVTDDPYAIYLSEIMLQQTQVKTVLERFYFPFLERFPTLEALAKAEQDEVLKYWQGLGYYNRARNLHAAAKYCYALKRRAAFRRISAEAQSGLVGKESRSARLPDTVDGLMALPGIGRNTAHAVAAFAYHSPVPVMEANVKRVLHRIFAREKASDAELFAMAEELLDTKQPFDYNQAMMDVGSLICTPKNPDCAHCPANGICLGKETPEHYPAPKTKKQVPVRHLNIYVVQDAKERTYMEQRTTRFLGGMYRFVEIESSSCGTVKPSAQDLYRWLKDSALSLREPQNDEIISLGHITHAYSHFVLEAEVYLVRLDEATGGNGWYTPEEMKALPHTRTEAKILKILSQL